MNSPNAPKRKMQTVNFHTVDEFLDYLPEDELKLVLALRQLVLDCIPGVTEKLVYNVPYYKVNRNICFIWPAAILWGNKKSYTGVRFAFTNGNLLQDEIGYLDKGARKQVYWKDFTKVSEIDFDLLKAYLFEAVLIDEELKMPRK
ncbi:MAG: DUF1801 domain-containing protein [Bacteroidetes bacterium]|nr:DUF1801 domain-containing protein [Bacteroidota bacterium]